MTAMASITRMAHYTAALQLLHAFFFLLLLVPIQLRCSFGVGLATRNSSTITRHAPPNIRCLPHEAELLLTVKHSLSFQSLDPDKKLLPSWRAGTDCCRHWEGVACDHAGRVAALNLSSGDLVGDVPIHVAQLVNLVSLDLSDNGGLRLHKPSFHTIIANLSSLKELHLDLVTISTTAAECSRALAKSVPRLEILSLSYCDLSGHIDHSMSSLRSLTVLDLSSNSISHVLDSLSSLQSLTVLDLSSNSISHVPDSLSSLQTLRVLDLSSNSISHVPDSLLSLRSLTVLDLSCNSISHVPDSLSSLQSLTVLDLSGNSISHVPDSLSSLQSLRVLDLSTNSISHVPDSLSSLRSLTVLDLSGNSISHVPDSLSIIRSLTVLDLRSNSISHVPDSFAGFQSLTFLDISHNNLGTFPLGILQLRNIEILRLSDINISRCVIPYSIGNLTSLIELYLDGNSFSGRLPSTFSNLTSLRTLQCSFCGLSGDINVLANLTRLEHVDLWYNNFTGPIHFGDQVELIYLAYLDLSFNLLSQTIPPSLFTYPELEMLDLRNNQFSGVLEEFSNPSSTLADVYLSGNRLSGPIPSSFSRLASLQTLDISQNNFTGTLKLFSYFGLRKVSLFNASNNNLLDAPNAENSSSDNPYPSKADWRTVPQLDGLDLSWNHIRGEISSRVWSMVSTYLDLSHNMFTVVSQPPTNTTISYIDLSYNMLHGPVPLLATGASLDYSHNKFSSIPSNNFMQLFRGAVSISLANNEISGPIPYVECNSDNGLQMMDLSNNNFSGPVPSYLLNCHSLLVLKLSGNNLSGSWPDNFREGCSLELIHFHENRITGPLPRSLTRCRHLVSLNIGHNFIVDSFPSWLGELPELAVLVLRSNQLYGSLPSPENNSIAGYFQNLHIVDLAKNMFSGALPRNLFRWSKPMTDPVRRDENEGLALLDYYELLVVDVAMKELYINLPKITEDFVLVDLSYNQFHGPIPKTIGKLSALHVLNMSGNAFTGEIPHELGRLIHLESLDLSWNRLSGEIPPELATLTFLECLDLSYNNLSGRIPSGPQFSTFNSSSFQGNSGLYGCPLPRQCNLAGSSSKAPALPSAPSASKSNSDKFGVIMLYLFIGSGFGVGFAAAVVLMHFCNWGKWWHRAQRLLDSTAK